MWSYQLEAVAHERVRTWEKEAAQRQVLAHLPPSQKPWQQGTGQLMMWMGAWLLRLGERLIKRESPASVASIG